jgi:CheY-like chemotaxis protein
MLKLLSRPGRGTKAELWLPAATKAPATVEVSEAAPAQAPPDDANCTILVVDDDVLIAASTVDMVEDLGFRVIEANSGAKALEILGGDDPVDLMVTDFAMPGMNGMELARAAKEVRPDLPVLLASGYAETPLGAETDLPRLAKPYRQEQLATQIAQLLKPGG